MIHKLQEIQIVNAKDLENTDFACYLGTNLQPRKLDFEYNPFTNSLKLKPTKENPDVRFKDIGFIKFGSTKDNEPNFCDSSSFQYTVTDKDTTDAHKWIYNL